MYNCLMKNRILLMKIKHQLFEVQETLKDLRSQVVWYKEDDELKAKIEKAEFDEKVLQETIKTRC
jgi:hypothetical protein